MRQPQLVQLPQPLQRAAVKLPDRVAIDGQIAELRVGPEAVDAQDGDGVVLEVQDAQGGHVTQGRRRHLGQVTVGQRQTL